MSNLNAVWARNTENAPQFIGISSQTVAFSHYNNLSAQLPIDPKTGEVVAGDVKIQAKQCLENIKSIVESIDHVMTDVVRLSIFVTNIKDLDKVDEVCKSYFPTYVPTLTRVAVNELPMGADVQIEALLSHGEGSIPNAPQSGDLIKLVNNTPMAPSHALSSQTVAFSHYNNLTAQLPIDVNTGRLVIGGITEQTRMCLKNVKSILQGIDVPFDDIVKVNIYLTDLKNLDAVNEVYSTFFPDSSIARAVAYVPALSVIEAVALPMDALVQVEAVVSHGDGTPPQLIEDRHGIIIEANTTEKAPINPLATQTVAFSHYNHISAQLPVDPKTGALESDDVEVQTETCLTHIKNIIESIDHTMEDVVKINIFVKNIKDMDKVDTAYKKFFPKGTPARRVVGVANILKGAAVQVDAVVSNAEGTPPVK